MAPESATPEVTLEWAIKKFGASHFTVQSRWGKSNSVFREEERSTLESTSAHQNIFGGMTNWGILAGMRNLAKVIKGQDREKVKVYADELAVRIRPKERRMKLAVIPKFAEAIKENASLLNPVDNSQDIVIPTFMIASTHFGKEECRRDMEKKLMEIGLGFPVEREEPEYPATDEGMCMGCGTWLVWGYEVAEHLCYKCQDFPSDL